MGRDAKLFVQQLKEFKKIAVINTPKQLDMVVKLKAQIGAVFFLTGNITVIKSYVDMLKSVGLLTFVHIEKIKGLSKDSDGLDFIANYVKPTGVVTTKPSLISLARKRQLVTIQRVFMIDSEIIENLPVLVEKTKPDIIEIMPARVPEIISTIKESIPGIPIITGGLIKKSQHAVDALEHGAIAISTSNIQVLGADLNIKSIQQ